MIIDAVIIAVRISTNDNDINNNFYNIYIKRSSESLQVDGRKWSCKSVSAVTARRAVLYKMFSRALRGGKLFCSHITLLELYPAKTTATPDIPLDDN